MRLKVYLSGLMLALCAPLTLAAEAVPPFDLTAAGQVKEKLSVKHCGKESDVENLDLVLNADGTWSLTVSAPDLIDPFTMTGTYVQVGSGRKLNMTLDQVSLDALSGEDGLPGWASEICAVPVTTSLTVKKFQVVVNKPETKANLIMLIDGISSSELGDNKLQFQFRSLLAVTPDAL